MTDLRYAIYAVPVLGHPSWTLAADWLGRDPEGGAVATGNRPDWLSAERWQDVTEDARHYGFHGTMKPPFALSAGRDAADLDAAIAGFAAAQPPLAPVELAVGALSGFLALLPDGPHGELLALADRCVERFDDFRAPANEAELARRRQAGLTPAQEAHLTRWGYPYVFEQFRFHMTLTARLVAPERDRIRDWLAQLFARTLAEKVPLELALFRQESRHLPFDLIRRYPLKS